MLRWMIPLVGLLVFACSFSASAEPDANLINALRAGGNVLVMRHGATRADQSDANPHDPMDWGHQRQLNDEGRAAARSMGVALHALRISVSQVQTSQFQRAVETGKLLGFGDVSLVDVLTEGHEGMSAKENARAGEGLRKLVATVPADGTNVILVTHKPNIVDAFGKDLSDVGEGETIVLHPDGKGGYVVIGRIKTADWGRLAQSAH